MDPTDGEQYNPVYTCLLAPQDEGIDSILKNRIALSRISNSPLSLFIPTPSLNEPYMKDSVLMQRLGISHKAIKRLISRGLLTTSEKVGIYTTAKGQAVNLRPNELLIKVGSLDALAKSCLGEGEIEIGGQKRNYSFYSLVQELRRLDDRVNDQELRDPLIRMTLGNPGQQFNAYLKEQVDTLLGVMDKSFVDVAAAGIFISEVCRHHHTTGVGMTPDEVLSRLSLETDTLNRIRFVKWYSQEHLAKKEGKAVTLDFKDFGSLFSVYGTRPGLYVKLFNTYIMYYADDEWIRWNNQILNNPAKRAGRQNIPMYKGGIDLRTNAENVDRFGQQAISAQDFAVGLFGEKSRAYVSAQAQFDFPGFIVKEAATLGFELKERDIFKPLPGGKYHPLDAEFITDQLKGEGVFDEMKLSFAMKGFLSEYLAQKRTTAGLAYPELENRLGIDLETAIKLGIVVDVGFIPQFSAQNNLSNEVAEAFYQKHLKNKAAGFDDAWIRDWRVDESELERVCAPYLKPLEKDIAQALEELKRQQDTCKKSPIAIPSLPKPIVHEGQAMYIEAALARIRAALKGDELEKRVRWGTHLRNFYEDPKTHGYMTVTELADLLGLKGDDRERLRAHYYDPKNPKQNAALVEIVGEKALKAEKGSISAVNFDNIYFQGREKAFVRIDDANQAQQSFVKEDKVSSPADFQYPVHVIAEEAKLLDIDAEALKPYQLNSPAKQGEYYFQQAVDRWSSSLVNGRRQTLQIALFLRNNIEAAEAKRTKEYLSLEQVAEKLGISLADVQGFERYLNVCDVSLAPILADMGQTSIPGLTEKELRQVFRGRYPQLRYTKGTCRLDSFLDDTYTPEQTQNMVVGASWLARPVFEYCLANSTPVYINGKIHVRDIDFLKSKIPEASTIVQQEVLKRLGIEKMPPGYNLIPLKVESASDLNDLTAKVDLFAADLFDMSKIMSASPVSTILSETARRLDERSVVGLYSGGGSTSDTWNTCYKGVFPSRGSFPGPSWHRGDVDRVNQAINDAATTLKTDPSTAAYFAARGYFTLRPEGISADERQRLKAASLTESQVALISRALNQYAGETPFFCNGEKLYLAQELMITSIKHRIGDIKEEGIKLLMRSPEWNEYLRQEFNRNPRKNGDTLDSVEARTVTKLLFDLDLKLDPDDVYASDTIQELVKYSRLLSENQVHGISRLYCNGHVDPETSYYSARDLKILTKWNDNRLQELTSQTKTKPVGQGKSSLYSLKDISAMARASSSAPQAFDDMRRVTRADDLDMLIIYSLAINGLERLKRLKPTFGHSGDRIKVNEDGARELAYQVKLDPAQLAPRLKNAITSLAFMLGADPNAPNLAYSARMANGIQYITQKVTTANLHQP